MKQSITFEQYEELSEIQRINYYNYAAKKGWYKKTGKKVQVDFWSIGQMMEYLGEFSDEVDVREYTLSYIPQKGRTKGVKSSISLWHGNTDGSDEWSGIELADALWDATKAYLEDPLNFLSDEERKLKKKWDKHKHHWGSEPYGVDKQFEKSSRYCSCGAVKHEDDYCYVHYDEYTSYNKI